MTLEQAGAEIKAVWPDMHTEGPPSRGGDSRWFWTVWEDADVLYTCQSVSVWADTEDRALAMAVAAVKASQGGGAG